MKIVQLLFFLILFLQNPNPLSSLSPDGLSLLALKSAMDSSPSSVAVFSDWNENDSNPCHWSGVSCMKVHGFPDPRVVGITIAGKNLKGYIPSELGSLIFLRRLNLHGNQLHGSIPDQLFNASSLHSLFLYGNNLTGSLPPSICNLPRLQNLDLSSNALSGGIPSSFSSCRELQRLVLSRNKFSGEIPVGIWSKLQNLMQLDLSSNSFTGEIPNDLGELKSLTGTLNLSFNEFTGEIPKTLEKLPVAVSFDLRNNNLSGEIPQKGTFSNQGPTAFLNNPSLCGFPLQKSCQNIENPSSGSSVSGQERGSKPKKGLKPGLIILISVADAAAVALIGLVIIYIYWKRKDSPNGCCSCTSKTKLGSNNQNQNGTMGCSLFSCSCANGEAEESDLDSPSEKDSHEHNTSSGDQEEGNLVAIDKGFSFELDELLRASAYVLGKSGLGIVYKVVLGNGIPVAVRRLGEGGGQRYKEFVAEIQAIGKIKHPNVVKLRAYYWAPDEKLLICDFISNGNLAFALHGRNGYASGGGSLSWTTRLKIAKGAARGLAYLHECSPRKFVHGDVKPTNILLDNDFNAYISDFGLNRLISITGSDQTSTGGLIGGALPYMKAVQTEKPNYKAPEARVIGMRPTQKWDVYSFGLVLLELLTGKSPESSSSPMASASTSSRGESGVDLVRLVKRGFEVEKPLSEMVDPMLLQQVHAKKEVMAVFHVALACTESDPEIRPRMKTVSENLDKIGN
ncbi:hypothetical protein C5167_033127 [Papaver somniferum]|uniref:non-specific serine/threonine protein kinase n=1 Tax=Papaver somniferum TaxID=3469 RepID=A0A4Y7KDA9_PAPSO|nr:receptor protein kinase-like protein ZAR1 [Papaver somniferum]RZC69998.1 hypothetical protein C5167_033127 [Papaver somniferum]